MPKWLGLLLVLFVAATSCRLCDARRKPAPVDRSSVHIDNARGIVTLSEQSGRAGVVTIVEPSGWMFQAVLSPDGRKILTMGCPHVRVWDTCTGKLICTLETWNRYHERGEIAWSPDSRAVATGNGFCLGSCTTGAAVWDAETGKAKMRLEEDGSVWFVAFSPDSSQVFTAGAEHNVYKRFVELEPRARIWDASTGRMLLGLQVKNMCIDEMWSISEVMFSADGSELRLTTNQGTRVFSCKSGSELKGTTASRRQAP